MKTQEELEKEIEVIDERIDDLMAEKKGLKAEIFRCKSGYGIGSTISYEGKKMLVVGFYGSLCPTVKVFGKDGTLGEKVQHLFSYGDVEIIEP